MPAIVPDVATSVKTSADIGTDVATFFWGEPPVEDEVVDGDLASAIRAQTEAITALVKRLDALAADPSPMAAVVAQTVVATLRSTGVLAGS